MTGEPLLALDTGETDRDARYASGSGERTLVFAYTVGLGDESPDLDYANTSALSLNGGAILGADGDAAVLDMPDPGGDGLLAGASALVVDGVRRADASASAVFVGPNTVRIAYSAPLGPPEGHEGPVYGPVTAEGAAAPMAVADGGVSGLGTAVHTIRFGGAGVAIDAAGSIALGTGLTSKVDGVLYTFAAAPSRSGRARSRARPRRPARLPSCR